MTKKKSPMANKKKLAKHAKQQQKITQKNHDALQLASKKYEPKVDWKLDFILKTHPSLIYKKLEEIDKKLDRLDRKK